MLPSNIQLAIRIILENKLITLYFYDKGENL